MEKVVSTDVKDQEYPVLKFRKEYTTRELVWGLLTGAALVGSAVINLYSIDYQNFRDKTSLFMLGGEAIVCFGCYFGYKISKRPEKNLEGLEFKISGD